MLTEIGCDDRVASLARMSGLATPSSAAVIAAWQRVVAAARAAWPTIVLDEPVLVTFIGARLVGADLVAALAAAPAADLALAAACASGEPTAHAAFDRVLIEVELAGAKVGASRDLVEEVKQLLRVQLLVPKDGKPAGIAGYRGCGPLRGWVRITATRELIRHKKRRARETPLDDRIDRLTTFLDPALEAAKANYRNELATALREGISDLSVEDRTLLVQHVVHDMSIDDLGAAFGVHRATAARWLQRARCALVTATRRRLAIRLELPIDQIESVIKMVRSQLDASVVRYLAEAPR